MTKTILVTGASKGIGRAVAVRLARDGFTVAVHYGRDAEGAADTLATIQAAGGEGRVLGFDIADRAACLAALEADMAAHGVPYGVVLNAGIARDTAFPAMTDEDWDSVLGTNLDGFYNVLRPLVMPMVSARRGGRIVTLSSVSGLMGNRGQVNYSAAKAGIIGATKALAIELAKRNITVNCVAPGVIETQMTEDAPLDEALKLVPMRRVGRPEEVAGAVSFLCSDDAGYVTRQVISVNGGMF
ncbi:3-ketoacyl-ACP reductase FabG2 [Azospirillum doebereinerae]|uniref:3-oxoacyl-ACP reductase FabG n=1 Tax=Azospirillum doebereinerae TaxID=92933 RepID=A0A3S0V8X5_9PROT|nr:3-ketoacyl-ACP reductase FabG2 [Azospirillum doebereinerae]MCG5240207.1 3-ketoacyl-ACP reductase FabG2 [Azospirillum doebereinerae]RUQ75888.1 3-oxoacyl-ACP reductase FabG [Azospirillum doebereinerae]